MAKLTDQDRETIRKLASGDKSVRAECEEIFQRCGQSQQGRVEIQFLSEFFNPAPDLMLRGRLRSEVLRQGAESK